MAVAAASRTDECESDRACASKCSPCSPDDVSDGGRTRSRARVGPRAHSLGTENFDRKAAIAVRIRNKRLVFRLHLL